MPSGLDNQAGELLTTTTMATHQTKSMSRGQRSSAKKNARRVDAVLGGELTLCTYGKVTRALGNKMFRVLSVKKTEHLARIRGKMTRVNVDDVVLLNIRDYETRSETDDAVYDIMAVFGPKDVQKLTKTKMVPKWFLQGSDMLADEEEDELYDLFDYEQGVDETGFAEEDDLGTAGKKKNGPLSKDFLMEL
jgi:translation initiation factor IF-1